MQLSCLSLVAKRWSCHALYRSLHSWTTIDPETISATNPATVFNFGKPSIGCFGLKCPSHLLVHGEWKQTQRVMEVVDPLKDNELFIRCPNTSAEELQPFVKNMRSVPKSGLHNPFKNPERYVLYGEITSRLVQEMRKAEVMEFFARLIQRVAPKSYVQCLGEVKVCVKFLENFCGDQVRFLSRGSTVPGDHLGQESCGYRWPFGPVALITPFNFPLEIPLLQIMGALYMGNRPLIHVDHRVSLVAEQFLRLLLHCGVPPEDLDFLNGKGDVVNKALIEGQPRSTLFTGSKKIAEKLAKDLNGKIFLEDAGFDWKILGPDVNDVQYVAWICDQDAYAFSGQKCSAQSILFVHENWKQEGLIEMLEKQASRRSLDDLTVGPVLTWTTNAMLNHVQKLLEIPGSRLLFGGKPLTNHTIPSCYGAVQPTAVFVPVGQILSEQYFPLVMTEVFGPIQVVTEYQSDELNKVLKICERLDAHLSAAVVSCDVEFQQKVLGNTVNGITYVGNRARTTGAPQNHWFGPAGDPRAAGIGTPEAIRLVWSCHREIVKDAGKISSQLKMPTS